MEMKHTSTMPPSYLTTGDHPGFLLHVSKEVTPDDWPMFKSSPMHYLWHLVVWENTEVMATVAPETQQGISSTKFGAKSGKYAAAKAYTWTCQLRDKIINPAEGHSWAGLLPFPCIVSVERIPGKDFVKVVNLRGWPDGEQWKAYLAQALDVARAAAVAKSTPAAPPAEPAPPAAAPVPPQMQSWGTANGQPAPLPQAPAPAGPPPGWAPPGATPVAPPAAQAPAPPAAPPAAPTPPKW